LDSTVAVLGSVLYDPHRRFLDADAGRELQIQHFACHGSAEHADPARYELTLAGGAKERWPIPLAELDNDFDQRTDGVPRVRPLVFLNACGSAHIDPVRMYSWPHWFLQNGHRGVIGTETLVPDVVAARFSEWFYEQLLALQPLGAAMVVARRRLLHEFMNPLGLLYVLYADPDLTVRYEALSPATPVSSPREQTQ
jgi:CHAT domain-containing protein